MTFSTVSAADLKAAARGELRIKRAREAKQMAKAGDVLALRFPAELAPASAKVVAGYAPVNDEISPGPLMARLEGAGRTLALPVVEAPGGPLIFRQWRFNDPLEEGAYGIAVPAATASVVEPDLVLVPCVGFDQDGRRLGYGGGYYDRTLAALRAKKPVVAVGLAFECQRLAEIPEAPGDQRLDWIVTEAAAYEAVRD